MINNFVIKQYKFNDFGKQQVSMEEKGRDWPVVYLINNSKSIYIGETNSAVIRFTQHLMNPERSNLNQINIIFDDTFNKSAILDIEQNLIQYFGADNKYEILNKNGGQSSKHNYYQRESYMSKFDLIWEELRRIGLANSNIVDIRNSDLFKYSPYNTLTEEQDEVSKAIIYDMIKKLKNKEDGTSIINGGAGTGKTIVLINMIYKLINASKMDFDEAIDDPELSDYIQFIHDIKNFIHEYKGRNGELKLAYISPMVSLRSTIKEVFNKTGNGLKGSLVMGPLEVVSNVSKSKVKYDIVFVDEAHRLAKRKNIGYLGAFDASAKRCGLDPLNSNLLDFIIKCSKYRVLIYDKGQTVKGSDITEQEFYCSLEKSGIRNFQLTSQLRCKGGNDYMSYVENIFNCSQNKRETINNYDLKLYDNIFDMTSKIVSLDNDIGLCRNVAGYSWKRISKGFKNIEDIKTNHKEDIRIDGYKYIWNMTNEKRILSENALETIGCIHTTQGYDLNYVGIIFGREIDYDRDKNEIIINKNNFFDTNVWKGASDKELKQYIINAYKVMMTRGIKGCYVYAYNKGLKDYLSKFIDRV